MRGPIALLLAALVLGGTAGSAQPAEEQEVRGVVRDAAGAPVADVEVATYWTATEGRWVARDAARTDAEGRYVLKVAGLGRSRSLVAFDASQERGAVALLDEASAAGELTLRLEPLTRVSGSFESRGLGHPVEKVVVSFTAAPAIISAATWLGAPQFSLPLPAASWHLRVSAVDCERVSKRVPLTPDMRAVDLGTTDLEPTAIARMYGKEPPAWNVTEARGLEPTVRIADFRGRWLFLEFWGHW